MGEELNRWLRRVRPHVPADDHWAASPEGQLALADLHLRMSHNAAVRRRRRRIWLPAGGLVAAAAVTAAVLLGISGSTTPPPPSGAGPGGLLRGLPNARPAAMLLSNYGSCSDLLAGLRAHTAAHTTAWGLPGGTWEYASSRSMALGAVAAPAAIGTDTTAKTTGATSTTNDQVAGVDEPDIIKTDGDRVVTVTDGVLRVIDAQTQQITGTLDLSIYAGAESAQLLVDGDHALVLLDTGSSRYYAAGLVAGPMQPAGGDRTTALFVDLSGQPTVTGSLRADGGYLAARLIDNTVRLVVASAPTINFPQRNHPSKARNQAIVRSAPLSAWQPIYTRTAGGTTSQHRVPCQSISHPAKYTGTSLVTVYTLDIADPNGGAGPVSVAADGDTVYATATSLYVASNPDWWTSNTAQQTQLHRFDITGTDQPTYLGSASVPGRLVSQYSLDDYDGYLRVATTTVGPHPSSGVYDLNDATLATVGHVGGLGKGEQIYAVRFAGPLAYVVTFRQTDPLYVVDLSDPNHPAVAGSLELTGYSSYLHDAGDGRIIGVGEQIGPDNEPDGVQVSLFDVSDPTAPQRTGHVVRKGTDGAEQLDPHAFLYWQPTGLVAVPIQSWSSAQSGAALVLRVDGSKLTTVGLVHNPLGSTVPDDGQGIVRSMLIDGRLWTLSSSGLQVVNPTSLHRDAWIAFS